MKVTWPVLKQFAEERRLSIQAIDLKGQYWLKVLEGAFVLECVISKEFSSPELDEYNAYVKTSVNKPVLNKTREAGFSTPNNTRPTVNLENTIILEANDQRRYAYICNNSLVTIYIKLGAAHGKTGEGIPLAPGDMYIIDNTNLWLGSIHAISGGMAAAIVDVFEGTP
jgi:hypothetical protein